ncbi:uncharacterized protein LOC126905497 isoform X2 [Daktulosphaira vitifoliae]|uniref:uncharacterized protein LOC126905497 isoform X2 n=1 Tax=Daktulosphaira vitifoliae TaxID=58002 RepID=UPI0021AA52CD|nr:uncharacterized protein LOC126905497 isoform X2 [Daktulosphaira vitifoliae]
MYAEMLNLKVHFTLKKCSHVYYFTIILMIFFVNFSNVSGSRGLNKHMNKDKKLISCFFGSSVNEDEECSKKNEKFSRSNQFLSKTADEKKSPDELGWVKPYYPDNESLISQEWIQSNVMDDIINYLIISNEKENSVDYIPSGIYSFFLIKDYSILKNISSLSDILKKDMIIISINTDPLNGCHWILGIIHIKQKKIIILDSFLIMKSDLTIHFSTLLRMLFLFYTISSYCNGTDFMLNINEWELVKASNALQQKNNYDCGLFVCLHALSFLTDQNFEHISTEFDRHWLLEQFNNYTDLKKNKSSTTTDLNEKNNLTDEEITLIEKRYLEEIKVMNNEFSFKIYALHVANLKENINL